MKTAILKYGTFSYKFNLCSDFGLSRSLSKEKGEDLTEYVVTRFYRAPEIMLSSHEVNISKDLNLIIISIQKLLMCGLLVVHLLKLSHQKFCFPDSTISSK